MGEMTKLTISLIRILGRIKPPSDSHGDGWIILKWYFNKHGMGVWNAFE
jgi:hypothetical protein